MQLNWKKTPENKLDAYITFIFKTVSRVILQYWIVDKCEMNQYNIITHFQINQSP